ncbi:hypothetical protein ALT_6584 [Aspergillus lentulus]|uniref:Uncharacterized protein n=1 Tax=Aspergillus lentulus TaxID=293939 RepID=A0AAN4TCU2_ASPLE|nr:hypothetical protein ALT_6584 [Aspergillus lentulus]
MRATQLALLALAASAKLATSFKIPEGMMDGVYKVYLNENGVEVHEPLLPEDIIQVTDPESEQHEAALFERADPSFAVTYCGCGLTMNHGDCDRAVQNLKNQFGAGTVRIGPNLAWYSISGSVVAFACNKVAAQAEASADRLTRALQGITERSKDLLLYPTQRERWYPMAGSRVASNDIGDDVLPGLVLVRSSAVIGYALC